MNVVCYEGEHWELLQLAFAGIFVYSLGIPLLFATLLWTHRQHLLEATTRNLLGFLFSGYTRHAYYYECVLMLRKVAIVAAASSALGAAVGCADLRSVVLLLVVGIVFLAVHIKLDPYDNRASRLLNRIETRSLWAFIFTALGRLLLEVKLPEEAVIAFVCLIHLNVAIFASMVWIRRRIRHNQWLKKLQQSVRQPTDSIASHR